MLTGSIIVELYRIFEGTDSQQQYTIAVDFLVHSINSRGVNCRNALEYYKNLSMAIEPVMLPYMSIEKQDQLLRDLQITYLLLLIQKKYESQHQQYEQQAEYNKRIRYCTQLIDAIHCKKRGGENPYIALEQELTTDGRPVKYLGFILGHEIAQQIVSTFVRNTKTIKESMGWFNEKRLYWVWSSVLIKAMLELNFTNFINIDQAKQTIRVPDIYTGCLSWALYYFRGTLNLCLVLKHTISGRWMTEEEQNIPWTERFTKQVGQRKFTLINDFLWATANLVCFFILTGPSALGIAGDFLTIALLVLDFTVSIWDWLEQENQYEAEIKDYQVNIAQLNARISALEHAIDSQSILKRAEYNKQLIALNKAKTKCESERMYQKALLDCNIVYAAALLVSFIVLVLPIAAPAAIVTGAMGAALCFFSTLIYSIVKNNLAINKTKEIVAETNKQYSDKEQELKALINQNPSLNDDGKKFLYLELKSLIAETMYQEQTIRLQSWQLARSVFIDLLTPVSIFLGLVFPVIGVSIGIIIPIVAAVITNIAVNFWLQAKKESLPKLFNDEHYRTFCHKLEPSKVGPLTTISFFNSQQSPASSEKMPILRGQQPS